jgi:hypothetical protein
MPNFIKFIEDDEKEDRSINIGVTSDFARSPYAGLYPHDYKTSDKLSALRSELDQHIKELLEKGAVDAGNDAALDNFIASGIAACVEDINFQRAERQRIIIGLICRWQGDLVDGKMKCEDFQKELDEAELELTETKSLLCASAGSKRARRSPPENDYPTDDTSMEVPANAS